MTYALDPAERQLLERDMAAHAASTTVRLGPVFADLPAFLETTRFGTFVASWRDRQLHGRIHEERRTGYALRAPDMRGLAPGLFDPHHYRLGTADLPKAEAHAIARFLRQLIARTSAHAFDGDVATAVSIVTVHLAGPDGIATLDAHAAQLADLTIRDPRLYEAATLGDFVSARALLEQTGPDEVGHHHLIRLLARQRIIWSAADERHQSVPFEH